MAQQLDEHLSGSPKQDIPKLPLLIKSFLIYLFLLAIGMIIMITLLEGPLSGIHYYVEDTPVFRFLSHLVGLAAYTIIFTCPGYYLQSKTFPAFDSSIIQTALIPTVFWIFLLLFSFIYSIFDQSVAISDIPKAVLNISLAACWLFLLSLLISWNIKHKRWPIFGLLLCLHLLTATFLGIMIDAI